MSHLHELKGFVAEIRDLASSLRTDAGPYSTNADLYCETCRGFRRMYLRLLYWGSGHFGIGPVISRDDEIPLGYEELPAALIPSCFALDCVQCGAESVAVIYQGPRAPRLAILRSTRGGMASEHTPAAVSYYLEQAARAQNVGALSAAVVMYRSALEHLLYEQGYTEGMCGVKIGALLRDKANGKAPKWADQLHEDDLNVLNRLGSGAIHANGGDISKQEILDEELYAAVTLTFEALLEAVYERPQREAARRAKLSAAASKMR